MSRVTLNDAMQEAADLAGDFPESNPQYLRGMCELLARCFPVKNVMTDERAEQIKQTIILNSMQYREQDHRP